MGKITPFQNEKLVIGLLLSDKDDRGRVAAILEKSYGPCDYMSDPVDFVYTDYYAEEMGDRLTRIFLAFKRLVKPDSLYHVKRKTNRLEDRFRHAGKRRVNIDPGILNASRLILASTKNNGHRFPLRKGIYGELTLLYFDGRYNDLFWTYRDFRSAEYHEILLEIRSIYKKQIRER